MTGVGATALRKESSPAVQARPSAARVLRRREAEEGGVPGDHGAEQQAHDHRRGDEGQRDRPAPGGQPDAVGADGGQEDGQDPGGVAEEAGEAQRAPPPRGWRALGANRCAALACDHRLVPGCAEGAGGGDGDDQGAGRRPGLADVDLAVGRGPDGQSRTSPSRCRSAPRAARSLAVGVGHDGRQRAVAPAAEALA